MPIRKTAPPQRLAKRTAYRVRKSTAGYAPGRDVPLGGYSTLIAAFGGALGAVLAMRQARRGSGRISAADLALLGIATQRLTRHATRDWVTAPVRAPFTQYKASAGGGEVEEEARGSGLRKATGELITCRFCAGPWIAMTMVAGLLTQPRATRIVASVFTVSGISDIVHHLYDKVQK